MSGLIYLDNHATTRIDPAVSDAMREMERDYWANPGSITHTAGRAAAEKVEEALKSLANSFGCEPDEIVITSGATESNNLALIGAGLHPRQKRRCIVSVATEHPSVLDPLDRLRKQGFEIRFLPVVQAQRSADVGRIDLNAAEKLIDQSVALVSVMHSNNEVGVIQPLRELSIMCRKQGALLHTDASQSVGHTDFEVDRLGVDLASFSAHKFYGPKGMGGLFVRRRGQAVKLAPMIVGGGQQDNRRSGTLNAIGIVGMSTALEQCRMRAETERPRIQVLRNRLWDSLESTCNGIKLNGPELHSDLRLDRNLNCRWPNFEGQSLMLECRSLCVSSGSACTSAEFRPSHVLEAIGLSPEAARCSLRFGLGRFTTEDEVDTAVRWLSEAYARLTAKFR
jgi:cysteine desulfurase